MEKYNLEFKIKIVQKYLDGEGLFRNRQNQKYSVQFKLDAIELY